MTLHRQTPRLGITAAMRREEARPSGWARGGEGAEMRSVHVTPRTRPRHGLARGPSDPSGSGAARGPGVPGRRRRPPPSTAPGTRAALSLRSGGAWHVDGSPGQRACGVAAGAGVRGCLILGDGGREAASGPRELSPRLRQSGAGADGTTARRGRSASRPEEEGPEDCPRVTASQAREGKAGPQAPPPAQPECGRWGRQGTPAGRPGPCRAPAVGVAYSSR